MASGKNEKKLNCVVYKPQDYKIEKLIGRGSFSDVYKATHSKTNVAIALKSFKMKMMSSMQYRSAAKEIAFLETLDHPNIIQMKIYEINKMYVYIGTEFAEFSSLRICFLGKAPIAEPIIKHVMKQLIAALTYMHEMGIFHGDIKPDNILCTNITEEGPTIKIGDFGLTAIKLKGPDDMIFKAGSFLYMAPEIILRTPVDCSCDLWSAGILMYVMMFGRHIFRISEKDKDKHVTLIKRKTEPNYSGSENFSSECNSLVRNLLCYNRCDRLSGRALRTHQFIFICGPMIPSAEYFLRRAVENINKAKDYSDDNNYGEALVQGTKAVLNLKIHYNLINDAEQQHQLMKWKKEYEVFASKMEKKITQPESGLICPEFCENEEFRIYLSSTPKLLDGFDIGCSAEMFMKEGRKDKAVNLFHQALQLILPLMKMEPQSNRKRILGKKLEQWVLYLEVLTRGSQRAQQDAVAAIGNQSSDHSGTVTYFSP